MAGGRDPRGPVNVETDIIVAAQHPLTGMEAHANPDRLRPIFRVDLSLSGHRGGDCLGSALEDGEHSIAFRPYVHSTCSSDGLPHQCVVVLDDLAPARSKLPHQTG